MAAEVPVVELAAGAVVDEVEPRLVDVDVRTVVVDVADAFDVVVRPTVVDDADVDVVATVVVVVAGCMVGDEPVPPTTSETDEPPEVPLL